MPSLDTYQEWLNSREVYQCARCYRPFNVHDHDQCPNCEYWEVLQ